VVIVVIVGVVAAIAAGGKKSPTTSGNPGSASTTTSSQSGNTPKATATPTTPASSGNIPTGFTAYSGGLYTIAYPQDWTVEPSGQQNGTTSFTGPDVQILQVDVENVGDENTSQYLTL
jgi:hypothetical protein